MPRIDSQSTVTGHKQHMSGQDFEQLKMAFKQFTLNYRLITHRKKRYLGIQLCSFFLFHECKITKFPYLSVFYQELFTIDELLRQTILTRTDKSENMK